MKRLPLTGESSRNNLTTYTRSTVSASRHFASIGPNGRASIWTGP